MPRLVFAIAVLVASLTASGIAAAQTYPQRTVKFILPFGPASGTDITARLVGEQLSQRWGKPVVIENRPGGDGLVAINAFISANDDHTLAVGAGRHLRRPSLRQGQAALRRRPRSHPDRQRQHALSRAVGAGFARASRRSASSSIWCAANPGKYNAAAANGNADFLMSGFLKSNKLDMAKVPYRDIMQGPNDLAENRIQLLSSSLAIVTPLNQAGRIKILAVTGRKRAGERAGRADRPRGRLPGAGDGKHRRHVRAARHAARHPRADRRRRARRGRRAIRALRPSWQSTGQVIDVRGPAEFAAGIKELEAQLAGIAKVLGMKARAVNGL